MRGIFFLKKRDATQEHFLITGNDVKEANVKKPWIPW